MGLTVTATEARTFVADANVAEVILGDLDDLIRTAALRGLTYIDVSRRELPYEVLFALRENGFSVEFLRGSLTERIDPRYRISWN